MLGRINPTLGFLMVNNGTTTTVNKVQEPGGDPQYAEPQQPQPVQHIGLFGVSTYGLPSINNVAAGQQHKTIQLNAQSPRSLKDFWAVIIDTGAAIS
eukprot:4733646-Amphidinium_carterae.1